MHVHSDVELEEMLLFLIPVIIIEKVYQSLRETDDKKRQQRVAAATVQRRKNFRCVSSCLHETSLYFNLFSLKVSVSCRSKRSYFFEENKISKINQGNFKLALV